MKIAKSLQNFSAGISICEEQSYSCRPLFLESHVLHHLFIISLHNFFPLYPVQPFLSFSF